MKGSGASTGELQSWGREMQQPRVGCAAGGIPGQHPPLGKALQGVVLAQFSALLAPWKDAQGERN